MAIKKDSIKIVVDKLNSYAALQKNIEYLDKKIKIIDHELTKVKITRFEERRGGGNEYRIEKLLDKKSQLTNKLNDLKLEKKFIVEAVNSLDGIEREIIVDFYFKNYSISQISNIKLYSDRRIRQIKEKALNKLSSLIN